jgi:Leucine-rich repeat (LRR) protein
MYNYEWDRLKTWLDQYGAIESSVISAEEVRRLDLSGHSLKEIPQSFGLLINLLVLNLSNNKLTTLPQSMKNLSSLSNLDIRRNSFELLPDFIGSMPLRSLNASGNKITDISILGACKELRVLDMSSNSLKELGAVFELKNELRTLNLSNNFLKDIGSFLPVLESVQRLNLNGNLISELPTSVSSLVSLEEIEITDNNLQTIDEAFFELKVENVNFTANQLSSMYLHGLNDLEVLTLDENPLEDFRMSDDFAPYLRELSCDSCRLKEFLLPGSTMLESLCYSSNEISEVPSEIGLYEKLTQLDIDGNNIVDLPDTLANLLNLNILYILGNPLSDSAKKVISILDPEICDLNMKSGITVENAKEEDLKEMAELLGILFAIESDFEIDFDKQYAGLKQLYQNEGSDLLVARHENHVVGMLTMQRLISSAEGSFIGQLEDLVVKDDYRKMGVGSRLVNKMRALAYEHGYKRIQLAADVNNDNALMFYTRRGLNRTHLSIYHYHL